MATTTTIYANKDNWLYESSPTAQYGAGANLKIGIGGAIEKRTGIFEFDVSAITKPSDVVSAIFSLTESSSTGSVVNTMTLARLSQDFTESTSNWNTYDGSNAWASAGAEGDAELTEQTYTFNVKAGDISVDIKELVVDAINKRSGVLRFICFYNGTPSSSGQSIFDSRTNSSGNYPNVAVTVADRVVWSGALDSDLSDGNNWSWAGGVPTTNDIVVFNSGNVDATGALSCYSLLIGDGYTGDLGTSVSPIELRADTTLTGGKIIINKKQGLFSLAEQQDSGRSVFINNTSTDDNEFTNAQGSWNCFVNKTSGELTINGDSNLVTGFSASSKKVTTEGDTTDIVLGGNTRLFMENGCGVIYMIDAKATCNSGSAMIGADSFVTNGSTFYQRSNSMGSVQILSGTVSLKGNETSGIATEDIILWKNGVFDGRTTTGSWDEHATPSIQAKGGNFVVDAGRTVTISN